MMSTPTVSRPADLCIEELTARFETGTLPDGDLTHRDHVRVAWELLCRNPLGLALHRMVDGVQALAARRGQPNLYHETITTFYLLAIADARARAPQEQTFTEFEQQNASILGKSRQFLLRYYTEETLDSSDARSSFLLPERLPRLDTPGLTSSS
jgi:hypothetical protein